MSIHSEFSINVKDPNKKKPTYEMFSIKDWSTRFRKWMNKLRIIDRDNDLYVEKITDPETNEIIHHTNEKLSGHTNHGSAKKHNS